MQALHLLYLIYIAFVILMTRDFYGRKQLQ